MVALFHCVFDVSGRVMGETFGLVGFAFRLRLFVVCNLAGRGPIGGLCFFSGAVRDPCWELSVLFRSKSKTNAAV